MKDNDIREHYIYQICNLLTRKGNLYIFVNVIYFYLNNLTRHNRLWTNWIKVTYTDNDIITGGKGGGFGGW